MNRRGFFKSTLGIIGSVAAAAVGSEEKPPKEEKGLIEDDFWGILQDLQKHHRQEWDYQPLYPEQEFFYNKECDCWHTKKACFCCVKKTPYWTKVICHE